ncbi:MAG: hypothetical protein AAFO04_29530 [Cyanobacteria bacterium J06592_8]
MARETGNFDYIIDANTPNDIVMIWDGQSSLDEFTAAIDPRELFTVGTFLESIRLDVYLPSFDKAPFPDIYPEDSAAEKNVKLMKVEAKAPKCGIAFYRKKSSESEWHYLSEIVLQNRGRRTQIPVVVPYFTVNDLKILSRGSQIGIQKIDYGDGVIGEGPIVDNRTLDKIQVEGDYRIDLDKSEFERNRRVSLQETKSIGISPEIIIPRNPLRTAWEIQNQGDNDVFFTIEDSGNVVQNGGFKIQSNQVAYSQSMCEIEAIWAKSVNGSVNVAIRELSYL